MEHFGPWIFFFSSSSSENPAVSSHRISPEEASETRYKLADAGLCLCSSSCPEDYWVLHHHHHHHFISTPTYFLFPDLSVTALEPGTLHHSLDA